MVNFLVFENQKPTAELAISYIEIMLSSSLKALQFRLDYSLNDIGAEIDVRLNNPN